jgi:23S rRNA (uracil1939-C5)-methyltransferase
MLAAGQQVDLEVEKPAAGGRMIARHDGQVVFVLGAIPGERVRATIDRVERQLAFATVVEILDASPHRRDPGRDPLCGGCLYAHIDYAHQLAIKSDVVHDAFTRLGRIVLPETVQVVGSPEQGYRMRARLHISGERIGFYREGSHTLCDARQTGQMIADGLDAVGLAASLLASDGVRVSFVEISENIPGDQRALRVETAGPVPSSTVDAVAAIRGITGCTFAGPEGTLVAGPPVVADSLSTLTMGRAPSGRLSRRPGSFFQANRFLLPDLVTGVLGSVSDAGELLDLYAGVGLFSIALAATGRMRVTAVEGDRSASIDLVENAGQFGDAIRVVQSSVEEYVGRRHHAPETIIVDPPRTGISRQGMEGISRLGSRRVVYVSCDPATMARDARRLLDAGYRLGHLRAFDLFPNTPHVESLGLFELV